MNIEQFRELRKKVRILERRVDRHEDAIARLRDRCKQSDAPADQPVPEQPLPERVNDLESLRRFARAYLGNRINDWLPAEQVEATARELRDAMVENCSGIALHPRWSNTEHRHLDAVYWLEGNAIVDFIRASSDPGRIGEKLQWLVFPEGVAE